MTTEEKAHQASYKKQEEHLSALSRTTRAGFLDYEKTVDAWRHHRMMKPMQPFAEVESWTWLTIGDAHGWDAARLAGMGASDITASDLSDIRLEHARNEGIIQSYRAENAESMTVADDSYDVVFCKEAFHHLPRPWIGLYEMLRVARKAVLLIEPRDWIIDKGPEKVSGPIGLTKGFLRWMGMRVGLPLKQVPIPSMFHLGDKPRYEEVGNYMFSISSRELEKVALGLDLPSIGFFAVNDHFEKGLSDYLADGSDPEYLRVRDLLEKADSISRGGMGSTSLLLAAIFIEAPSLSLRRELERAGWYIKDLPRNPYLRANPENTDE